LHFNIKFHLFQKPAMFSRVNDTKFSLNVWKDSQWKIMYINVAVIELKQKNFWNFCRLFCSDTQSFLNFLKILNWLEVGVFARAVKLDSPGTMSVKSFEWLKHFLARWAFLKKKTRTGRFFHNFLICTLFRFRAMTSSSVCLNGNL
jgi:hypothetical protein